MLVYLRDGSAQTVYCDSSYPAMQYCLNTSWSAWMKEGTFYTINSFLTITGKSLS